VNGSLESEPISLRWYASDKLSRELRIIWCGANPSERAGWCPVKETGTLAYD